MATRQHSTHARRLPHGRPSNRLRPLRDTLLRNWHGLPVLPYLGQRLAYIADDPNLAYVSR